MKKVYVSPLVTEVNVEATNMLAASLKLNNNEQLTHQLKTHSFQAVTAVSGATCGSNHKKERCEEKSSHLSFLIINVLLFLEEISIAEIDICLA